MCLAIKFSQDQKKIESDIDTKREKETEGLKEKYHSLLFFVPLSFSFVVLTSTLQQKTPSALPRWSLFTNTTYFAVCRCYLVLLPSIDQHTHTHAHTYIYIYIYTPDQLCRFLSPQQDSGLPQYLQDMASNELYFIVIGQGSPCGVVANILDSNIIVNGFEL